MSTQLSTFTELGLVDARASAGSIILPSSSQIPGRIISFKDIYGAVANSTIVITTSSPDVFEDGTYYRTLTNPYDFLTVYAGSNGAWYVVGGNQFNWMRTVNQSNSGTSYFNNISTNFLYAISNVSTLITNTSNLNTTNITTTNISSLSYVATPNVYSFSSITSNITHPQGQLATIFAGASLAPAYSTSRISTISLGTSTNRWYQTWSLSTIASTIITDNAIVNNLVGGPILTATTTTNIYPYSAGSLVGFGSNTTQNGFYSEGHFRSTFTQVIQPTLDTGIYSNIVYINGNISTPNIYASTIVSGNFTITTGGFIQKVVSNGTAPSGTVILNLTQGNIFYFTSAMASSDTANFTTLNAVIGSTYYVNFLTGATPGNITFTGNTGATTLSITGVSLVGNPSVSIALYGAAQSYTPAATTRYIFTCIVLAI